MQRGEPGLGSWEVQLVKCSLQQGQSSSCAHPDQHLLALARGMWAAEGDRSLWPRLLQAAAENSTE